MPTCPAHMDSNMKSVLRSYLAKCGDGRGLDKFLRRNSFSSDERDNSTPITTKCRNKTKSLESLSDIAKKKEQTPKALPKEKNKEEKKSDERPKCMEHAKVVVKQSGEKLDKKKSQFNYESVIEITLPSAPTQSGAILDVSRDRTLIEENLEEPITPIISTPKIPQHNKMSPPSAHESFVSNKQNPMEWDSFIPGYEPSTQQNFQLCNPMELGDSELNALKTYFQKNGLQLPNENLVVVIKNRQESRTERDRQFSEIKKNKEKWQNIYEKYKEKYHQSNIDFHSPDARSTPKLLQTSVSKMNEKSSQTSLVRNTVKSTQVETSSVLQRSSKECQVTVDRGSLSSKHSHEFTDIYQNQSEVAESFEFIAGSMNQVQHQRKNDSPVSSSSKSDGSKHHEKIDENSVRNSEASQQNEDISNFDDSLKVAIALLNSLLESRHMKPELKRNLAGKVIQKIVQIQTSRSIQTSTLSSGIYPLSNSSRASSAVPVKLVKEESSPKETSSKESSSKSCGKSREDVLKDCLKPMTQSEVNYQHSVEEEPTKGSSNSKSAYPKNQLMNYVKREKLSHLKWIEKEIEHLRNLRDLLKRNETPISMDENSPLYANLSSLLFIEKKKEPDVVIKASEPMPPPSVPGTNVWNSHANTKKISKQRSKLDTPEGSDQSHEESLASFIDNKNRKFMEKYEKHQKVYEDRNVYTRPYSGNKKLPEAPRIIKSKSGSKKTQTTATKDVQTSTSLGSSSVFESSDSISVPVNTNTKTSTTHYQSEALAGKDKKSSSSTFQIKQKISGTQTTDSICRSRPIYEVKSKTGDMNFGTTSTTVTQRIYRMKNDKQQQTNPSSIRYTLSFDKKCRANVRSYMTLPQQVNSEYAVISKSSKEIYNQRCSGTLDNRHSENKENQDVETIIDDDDEIDLQSCLNQKRPDLFTRFEARKSCIAELKKLRILRNEHRKKLLLLTSDKSLEGKLFNNLPELPLRTTRMFSTKALKRQTQKTFRNLTEVQQKKKEENLQNLKRKNRLITKIFNKNLQRNVLKGNLNQSNTVNMISK